MHSDHTCSPRGSHVFTLVRSSSLSTRAIVCALPKTNTTIHAHRQTRAQTHTNVRMQLEQSSDESISSVLSSYLSPLAVLLMVEIKQQNQRVVGADGGAEEEQEEHKER